MKSTPQTWRTLIAVLLAAGLAAGASAANPEADFDAANKLFEEGKYAEAASAYERLIAQGTRSAPLYYNLGTARYKLGQLGWAIAAYRQASDLAPRDASLRANLDFVRKRVNGEDFRVRPAWREWLHWFNLNEGAWLAAGAFWVFFLLLAIREWNPLLTRRLRRYTILSGSGALILTACLAASVWVRWGEHTAIVIVKEAVAKFGPLEEAKTAFTLPDGSEVPVLDTKGDWLQVKNATEQVGWVRRSQVVHIQGRHTQPPHSIAPGNPPALPVLTPPAEPAS